MAGMGGAYLPGNFPQDGGGGGQTTASSIGTAGLSSAPTSSMGNQVQHYETPRRNQNLGRQPEELHIPPSNNLKIGQSNSREISRHHSYHASQEPSTAPAAPGISIHQATPHGTHNAGGAGSGSLPGALRPGAASVNTAPGTVPTLPQISTQTQQYSTPSRSSTASHSHSYSRSSPAGLDQQKHAPYVNTPESSKFPATPNQKYSSQTPHGSSAYSPLGLADIRPEMTDGPLSANPYSSEFSSLPTNSNYLAPWPVYAFDWCKWPVQSNAGDLAGKIALGSYVEDGHNFVSAFVFILQGHSSIDESCQSCKTDFEPRSKYSTPTSHLNPTILLQTHPNMVSISSKQRRQHTHIQSREYYGNQRLLRNSQRISWPHPAIT